MKVAALAMLQDLVRSRKLIKRGKGKSLTVRPMKKPAYGSPRSKVLVRMNGLGELSPHTLIREAEVACRMLKVARSKFSQEEWHPAIDAYFKAAAIATNVIFTANVHDMQLPDQLYVDMNIVIAESTHGIKMIMKVVATKGLVHHEKTLHKGKARGKKSAAAFMRHLMREGRGK